MAEEKKFTRAELATFHGEDGRPAYVAYKGVVIDVSSSKLWRDGMHMKRHVAGQDLTEEILAAPHDVDVLDRFPRVGILEDEIIGVSSGEGPRVEPPIARSVPGFVARFLERHPFFMRHPHPMTVHFPIVFFISAPLFTALALITGVTAFEVTAVNCLGAALLFSLVVIPTGLFTWWVNYGAQRIRAVTIKIVLSLLQFVMGLSAFIWRLSDPTVLRRGGGETVVYLMMVFSLLPMIIVVGWYGATLTFPLRRQKREWRRRKS
jgi:predicted heme/steroid binding protein/uncharacterized membrane protein